MAALGKLGITGALKRPAVWNVLLLAGIRCPDGGHADVGGASPDAAALVEGGGAEEAVAKLAQHAAEVPEVPSEDMATLHSLRAELCPGTYASAAAASPAPGELDPSLQSLNNSQRLAVASALERRTTLVQGPPGTGKTHVSVGLLALWARHFKGKGTLLATSDSNIAVDNIAEGLQKAGLKVVRVGRFEKITSQLEDITLEAMTRRRRIEAAREAQEAQEGDDEEEDNSQRQQWMEDHGVKLEILRDADVICTTTISSGSELFSQLQFRAILIDEVAQATELSALVPIVARGCQRLVLVGDHRQLPPTVLSSEAKERGLAMSLFSRLAGHGLEPFFLDTQFRMHPSIASFSAAAFYGGRLKTGVPAHERPRPMGFAWPQEDSNVAFVDVPDGQEQQEGGSWNNWQEVQKLTDILVEVLSAGELSVLQVGVVTPYSSQVQWLRRHLRQELWRRLDGVVDLTGGLSGQAGQKALEIASVDAFQGREKELILFSAVRSNRTGRVGFLADCRRLNVMVTRARRGLIVVGNASTLRSDATWRAWLDWAHAVPPTSDDG
mmetsp:Transcript_99343/g.318755  ORF Transcript_99343/g.318755 Transcript_99343/m.318755 type:complete len:554 (-) Transcript_99343:708-2369(-)